MGILTLLDTPNHVGYAQAHIEEGGGTILFGDHPNHVWFIFPNRWQRHYLVKTGINVDATIITNDFGTAMDTVVALLERKELPHVR